MVIVHHEDISYRVRTPESSINYEQYSRLLSLANELESDKYTQGRGMLKFKEDNRLEHCCLGVGCEMYIADHNEANWYERVITDDGGYVIDAEYSIASSTGTLPSSVARWMGMPDVNGFMVEYSRFGFAEGPDVKRSVESIAWANDMGVPFPLIAQLIRDYAEQAKQLEV